MIICSELAPVLNPDHVCDLIIQAIRQNQYRLLIPKSLNINLVLGRFENENTIFQIHRTIFLHISLCPAAAEVEIQNRLGAHQLMDDFIGRQ